MRIITLKHLSEAAEKHSDAAEQISVWITIVRACRWSNFIEVRDSFPDADCVDGYTIFNFRWNKYRLLTVIHYLRAQEKPLDDGRVYIRS